MPFLPWTNTMLLIVIWKISKCHGKVQHLLEYFDIWDKISLHKVVNKFIKHRKE